MWPFKPRRNRKTPDTDRGVAHDNERPKLSNPMGDRGLEDLHNDDAELRIWLPEACKQALEEVAPSAMAKYLRELFVIHLYGRHELLRMRINRTGLYYEPPPVGKGVLYSRTRMVDLIPGLGKNICPLKLFLPERMKDDLSIMAERAGMPLSRHVREILVSHLFGHTFWPARLHFPNPQDEQIATQWEKGELAPVHVPDGAALQDADGVEGKPVFEPRNW